MRTRTVSLRLAKKEAERLDQSATELGVERATFLRWALRRGTELLLLERALQAYRQGKATLSRAAEIAGVSLHEMILQLREQHAELNYGPDDLEQDLQSQ